MAMMSYLVLRISEMNFLQVDDVGGRGSGVASAKPLGTQPRQSRNELMLLVQAQFPRW